jgi:phosphoenolpyruvate carboxykinase (ATP)
MTTINLEPHGITVNNILRNPSPGKCYEQALSKEAGSAISSRGALIAISGHKTGRSPNDKRVVNHEDVNDDVWWGDVNVSVESYVFGISRQRAIDYLNSRDQLYVIDGFAGWDTRYRIKIRIICERGYHALFMRNMLIRPTAEELADFGDPDYVIYNAGAFPADPNLEDTSTQTSISLCLSRGEFVILGSEYAGEMKKGVFTIMNYIMPKQGILSMHCSSNEGPDGDVSIFFGLSGTGKTTLSADPARRLIGDDEHCWTDDGIFNIEGGCYAKVIDLSESAEPDIYRAIRFGAVLENVVYDEDTREVDYTNKSITENTRCSYPIEYIDNARIPCVTGIPNNIIFLTCDAFSVLPPVSKLNPAQAMYHFISGYTAKVAGTEMGITEPQATFSSCFGAPFLVWHPTRYAELLAERIRETGASVWLVNTGWSGGPYGVGKRMSIAHTRAIINAIHSGDLENAETRADPVFGISVPTTCPGVPSEILIPENTWEDKLAFEKMASKLAGLFHKNFESFADQANEEIKSAAPNL